MAQSRSCQASKCAHLTLPQRSAAKWGTKARIRLYECFCCQHDVKRSIFSPFNTYIMTTHFNCVTQMILMRCHNKIMFHTEVRSFTAVLWLKALNKMKGQHYLVKKEGYFFFFFFFDLGFTALSRIFHLYRADRSSKVGENQRTRRKTTWPSVSRTWLSHIWPERGSNHSGEKPNGLRVNSLIH